jgi:multisubunit Na+/H+ antiporter MnhB subunit
VLLLAVLGVLALRIGAEEPAAQPAPDPLLSLFVRVMAPLILLVAGYVLWIGSHAPGGAFQAGAMLAATGVLARLAGVLPALLPPGRLMRAGLTFGFAVFLGIGAGALGAGGALLEYPRAWAGALIVAIEAGLALSIGLVLISAFLGAPPPEADQ